MIRPAIASFLLFVQVILFAQNNSGDDWASIKKSGKGSVNFYWFPNNTTVDESKDVMDGVEHDLGEDFIDFLRTKYELDIKTDWNKTSSFSDVLDVVTNSTGGSFGFSSISITQQRDSVLNFSPAYFPDVSVIVSSGNVPIASSSAQFKNIFQKLTAVTIENTTLEMGLLKLKDSLKLDFDIIYVDNGGAIIEKVESMDNAFAYSDLPNFLSALPRSPNVKRQVFFPQKLRGLGMVYPDESDWTEPINEYFTSPRFQAKRKLLIEKFMGSTVDELIERISKSAEIGPDEEIVILAEELELRYQEQLEANLKAQESRNIRNSLIAGVVVLVFIVALVSIRAQLKSSAAEELEKKQKEIEDRNDKLEFLNNEKNNLIQVLAHDLRNPISKIIGFADLIADTDNLNYEQLSMLDSIQRSSFELKNMIGKILDVQAIESGERNLKLEQLDLNKIIQRVVFGFKHPADAKKIELIDESPDDQIFVNVDKTYFPRILENLISNALKFSQPGTKISIGFKTSKGEVEIFVSDEGPGFSPDDQKRIFKKYQHLSARPTAGEPSTGLGLSIIKSYTEMMGGKITFETELGVGTTFKIKLPTV